jgi:hypothetical protein
VGLVSAGASLVPSGKSGVIVTLKAVFSISLYAPIHLKSGRRSVACLANIHYAKQQTSERYFKEEV